MPAPRDNVPSRLRTIQEGGSGEVTVVSSTSVNISEHSTQCLRLLAVGTGLVTMLFSDEYAIRLLAIFAWQHHTTVVALNPKFSSVVPSFAHIRPCCSHSLLLCGHLWHPNIIK